MGGMAFQSLTDVTMPSFRNLSTSFDMLELMGASAEDDEDGT